ncbi:unnamed protein product [Effrenium voratum]|uniref:RRM domain-containing protein n=1 Tax=Effrenium voratum TaxID=2562239 RepID=A0AA36NAC6_9DINO|nr:unnamed protein product [Effrenium voratum]
MQTAVVRMGSSEQAGAAVAELNGLEMGANSRLAVSLAKNSDAEPSEKLRVSGLPSEATAGFLRQLFGPFGKILDVKLSEENLASGRSAMVRMSSMAGASLAIAGLNGQTLDGSELPLHVRFYQPLDAIGGNGGVQGRPAHRDNRWPEKRRFPRERGTPPPMRPAWNRSAPPAAALGAFPVPPPPSGPPPAGQWCPPLPPAPLRQRLPAPVAPSPSPAVMPTGQARPSVRPTRTPKPSSRLPGAASDE